MVVAFIQTYAALVLLWIALNGPNPQEVAYALIACLPIAWLTRDKMFTRGILEKIHPARLAHALAYIPYFLYLELTAHLSVFYRVLTGRVDPELFRVPLDSKRYLSITTVANSVTLTPGTITVTAAEDALYIHSIDRNADVAGPVKEMERHLAGVFE